MTYTPEDFENASTDFNELIKDGWERSITELKDESIDRIHFALLFAQHMLGEPTKEMAHSWNIKSDSYFNTRAFKAMRDMALKEVLEKMETTNDQRV